jgi:hypothetical protein
MLTSDTGMTAGGSKIVNPNIAGNISNVVPGTTQGVVNSKGILQPQAMQEVVGRE